VKFSCNLGLGPRDLLAGVG